MFLTNKIELSFGDLSFTVCVPSNADITRLFLASEEATKAETITPDLMAKFGDVICNYLIATPEGWESFPEITKTRLLFDIAKFVLNEAISIPELKKKS